MNQKPFPLPNIQVKHIPDPNPWETLKTIPHVSLAGGILLSLLVVACALYQLPFDPPVIFTLPLLVCCALALIGVVRSAAVGVACGVLFVCGFFFGGFSAEVGLALVCPVFVMGLGAYLISTFRAKWLISIPVVTYILALLFCGDAAIALLSLIAMPAAGILAHQTMRNQSRVSVICMTTLLYGLCFAFGFVLLAFRTNGSVSLTEMVAALETTREEIIAFTLGNEQIMQMLNKTYEGLGVNVRDVVVSTVNLLFNLLPGMAIVLVNVLTYTAQLMCTRAYVGTGVKSLLTRTAQLFILSVPAGLIYTLCLLITIFSGASNMFTALVQNLLVILLPGMTLVGIFKLAADLKRGTSRVWLFIMIACAIFFPYMLILCIAFSGAMTTLTRPLVTRMMLKMQNQNGPKDPDDPKDPR